MIRNRISTGFIIFLCCYCILNMGLRLLVSDSLENDEAEQILLSEHFSLGYNSQPPLYNWIQNFFFRIFGYNLFAVAFLKNILIFLLYGALFRLNFMLLKDRFCAVLSVISLFPVYQFHWMIIKDLSHSLTVLLLFVVTFSVLLMLTEKKSFVLYLTLGLCLGLGVLSKYTYIVFVLALLGAAACLKPYRAVLRNPGILLSFFVALFLIVPHALWLRDHSSLVFSSLERFRIGASFAGPFFRGIYFLLRSIFLFIVPLIVLYGFLFFPAFKKNTLSKGKDPAARLVMLFSINSIILIILCVAVFRISYIEPRWLQPLLVFFPVLFFLFFPDSGVPSLRSNIFIIVSLVSAVVTLFLIPGRIIFAEQRGKFNRLNYPVAALADALREEGFRDGLIIAQNYALAGDLKINFPGSFVIACDKKLFEKAPFSSSQVLLVWEPERTRIFFHEAGPFDRGYHLRMHQRPVSEKCFLYKYSEKECCCFSYILIKEPVTQKSLFK